MSERTTRRLVIRGLVQGVWYRETMRREAERLGVTGWVRNRLDGSVEAVVQGESPAVEAIVRWARGGPPGARVEGLEEHPAEGTFERFEKRETA
ncbi:MAG TPA: acylphosphatase [Usitatibacter sp.]|nr:acylphosphatase [Usitatibacter sp.]